MTPLFRRNGNTSFEAKLETSAKTCCLSGPPFPLQLLQCGTASPSNEVFQSVHPPSLRRPASYHLSPAHEVWREAVQAGFGLRRVYMCSLNQQVSGYSINPFHTSSHARELPQSHFPKCVSPGKTFVQVYRSATPT